MFTNWLSFRWTGTILPLGLAWILSATFGQAEYIRPDLVNVPVERLTKNLEELARKNPKDARVRFNLARVHAMAYALKTDTAKVWRNKEDRGAWFGYEPAHVPFRAEPTKDKDKLKAAKDHLNKAIEQYEEVLKREPKNLSAALGHAWCLDQSGARDKAITAYRKVIADAWMVEKDLKTAGLGWHSVTVETARYLIPLLDSGKDKEEINTLNVRIKRMRNVSRPITPVVIPLREGLTVKDLEDRSASVAFDADGSGLKKNWTWITREAGWLVYDPHATGKVTSALQLFGGVSFWMFWDNGYQALSALDDNGDGMLTGKELQGLAIWQDRNGNGICEPGEVRPLAEWAIIAISCRYERDTKHPEGIAFSPRGVYFRDGSIRATYDIVLRPR